MTMATTKIGEGAGVWVGVGAGVVLCGVVVSVRIAAGISTAETCSVFPEETLTEDCQSW